MMSSIENCERQILLVDGYVGMLCVLEPLINVSYGLKVCAVARSVDEALKAIENQSFDLAVVDISIDYASGLELTEIMKSRCPEIPVVIFSSHDELSFVKRAFRAGARGYLAKPPDTAEEIVTAIRQVLGGGIYMSQRIAQKLSASDIERISTAWAGDDTPHSRTRRP
jgi:DNA-binding NarL/FixJ family response regulator